jgi:hypothetical protein
MLDLESAIKHCEEVAKAEEQKYKEWKDDYSHLKKIDSCLECAKEHRQLAEWLRQLKEYKDARVGCEYCKHNYRAQYERPCSLCQRNFMDMFESEVNADEDSD